MNDNLAQKSISLALEGSWKEAIKTNKEILKENPSDTETLNRLAKAYFESGDIIKAKSICQKVLRIAPIDSIASKNLAKWKGIKGKITPGNLPSQTASFIEEAGRTKLVPLLNLGDSRIITKLNACDEVKLAAHAHKVSLTTLDNKYVGRLPDDLASRLRHLISAGNTYQVIIKSIDQKGIKVFIKELQRSKKMQSVPSFPLDKPEPEEVSQNP